MQYFFTISGFLVHVVHNLKVCADSKAERSERVKRLIPIALLLNCRFLCICEGAKMHDARNTRKYIKYPEYYTFV